MNEAHPSPFRPWVHVVRGGHVESVHEGILVVVDDEGNVRATWGDPEWPTFLRSSLKMFQAIPVVESGAADAFGYGPRHLALVCASHNGEPEHVELARDLLFRAGRSESELRCGAHPPAHDSTRREMTRRSERWAAIHNNCSGKHAGMLSVCTRRSWDVSTYLTPEHPLQREIVSVFAEYADLDAAKIPLGIDGCGVPTLYAPIAAFARALARFAGAGAGRRAHPSMAPHAAAAARLFDAMTSHPELVGGTGRFCTELPRAAGRPLLAKAGAEGFYAVAWREPDGRGVALAAKAAAGDSRSRDFAVTEALLQLGVLSADGAGRLAPFHAGPMKNHAGTVVGKMESAMELSGGRGPS